LQFPEDTSIRTVFSIFKGASFLLTDVASGAYNFHRYNADDTDPTAPLWDGPSTNNWASSYITGGTTSVNGIVADYSTTDMPVLASQNGYNLVAVSTTGPVIADSFNADRNTIHNGNQSQAEVIVYNTLLNSAQVQQVEAYLDAKWFGIGVGSNILPTSTPVTLSNGATLDMSSVTQTIGSLSSTDGLGSKVLLGNGTLTVGDSTSTTFDGAISGVGGSLIKQGTGMLVLSGSDTYTGGTTINAGTLVAASASAIPNGTSLTVGAGGTFIFDPSQAGAPVVGSTSSAGVAAVPEPGTLALLAATLLSAAIYRRFRRRSSAAAM
jgi:autotransporter-associated beta strand protein